uniref:Mesothelin like n=1 Tax=Mandrillus leucophaeus TaxID=9568 RepID=A0A2K5ZAU2_MANLE
MTAAITMPGALQSSGLTLLLSLAAHCSGPQAKGLSPGGLDASGANLWASANCSLLQGFWCQPASQLPRDQLSALIQRLALLQRPPAQLSCLANLASRCGLQDDFTLHPPNLLLFYNLSQVREVDCRAFIRRAAQGDVELLSHLPDQRVALHISAADPHVLENLQRCPRLTTAQRIALNSLLAGGKTSLGWGAPGWTQASLARATNLSPHPPCQAVGLGFFGSMVAACRAGRLSQHEARRFVTSFLESKTKLVSSRPRLSTGQSRLAKFLVRTLGKPRSDQGQKWRGRGQGGGLGQARRSHSEVLSGCEFGGTLFTPAQRVRGKLWLRKGGPCPAVGRVGDWWPTPQPPASPRLAGALDVSSCPQSRKDVLYAKAREAFSSSSRTPAAYYHFMRPYLAATPVEPRPLTPVPPGGAPAEELQHLAQANISMDIDTFTSLNPRVLQSLDVSNVTALLGHNVGDLQKARSHPTVRSWLYSLNSSALGQLGLDASPAGPATHSTSGPPSTTHQAPHLVHTSGLPGNAAQASTSGSPWAPLGYLPLAVALPSSLLWLLHWGTCTLASVDSAASGWLGSQGSGAGKTGLLDSTGHPLGLRGRL